MTVGFQSSKCQCQPCVSVMCEAFPCLVPRNHRRLGDWLFSLSPKWFKLSLLLMGLGQRPSQTTPSGQSKLTQCQCMSSFFGVLSTLKPRREKERQQQARNKAIFPTKNWCKVSVPLKGTAVCTFYYVTNKTRQGVRLNENNQQRGVAITTLKSIELL